VSNDNGFNLETESNLKGYIIAPETIESAQKFLKRNAVD